MTAFLMIFRRFSKIFQIVPKTRRTFPNIFREFPKMSEDFRRLPSTFEEDPKMFRWYSNEFKYNLREKPDVGEIIDIFTGENIISSHVRRSYRFYQFVTTRYTTDFYIINFFPCELWGHTSTNSNDSPTNKPCSATFSTKAMKSRVLLFRAHYYENRFIPVNRDENTHMKTVLGGC